MYDTNIAPSRMGDTNVVPSRMRDSNVVPCSMGGHQHCPVQYGGHRHCTFSSGDTTAAPSPSRHAEKVKLIRATVLSAVEVSVKMGTYFPAKELCSA